MRHVRSGQAQCEPRVAGVLLEGKAENGDFLACDGVEQRTHNTPVQQQNDSTQRLRPPQHSLSKALALVVVHDNDLRRQ